MKDNMSQIVLPDPSKPLYNLENTIRALGQQDNSFAIGIFDCCRDPYDQNMYPKKKDRGGDDNEMREEMAEKGQNYFLIFGCPPNQRVPANSKITPQFFQVLRDATADNGCILLPDAGNVFITWAPNK